MVTYAKHIRDCKRRMQLRAGAGLWDEAVRWGSLADRLRRRWKRELRRKR